MNPAKLAALKSIHDHALKLSAQKRKPTPGHGLTIHIAPHGGAAAEPDDAVEGLEAECPHCDGAGCKSCDFSGKAPSPIGK